MKRVGTPFVLAGVVWAALLAAQPAAAVPILSLSASCTPSAQGTFTITNTGSDMTGPGTYTLLLNGTPIATNSFQLNAGASTNINTSGLYGTLELDASGGGAAPATASTFCLSPTATPTPVPPTFSLSASCTPSAQGTFVITNTGSNMTGPGTYTLLLNGTPIATNSFQLNAGQSTNINTSGLYGTLELDVSGGGAAPAKISTFCMSPTATPTVTPTGTLTPSATPTPTATATATATAVSTPTPSPTPSPSATPTPTPTRTPLPTGAVAIDSPKPRAGETVYASGQVPVAGLPACLALVPNGTWTVGAPFSGSSVASTTLPGGPSALFTHVAVGAAPPTGAFDVLLLDGACGAASPAILAAFDAGPGPGLDLSIPDIPAVGGAGRLALAALLALAAVPLLRRLR